MATYVMFGRYSPEGAKGMSAARTDEARALIKRQGGELKSAYGLLGEVDLLVIVDLPDNARAMQTSIGLSKLLGVSFDTAPAVTVEEFDRLTLIQ